MEAMNITPENITSLKPHEIFVFGSNLAGIHGAGAAKTAHQKFLAAWGEGTGLTGQCYAIATKDSHLRVLPLHKIESQVKRFMEFAKSYHHLQFLVTAIGCGYAGYTPEQIAPMFANPPENLSLPASFWSVLEKAKPC